MPDSRSLTFLLGGARCGKSAYAEKLATALPAPWTYIATAQAWDEEMVERIALHRARRTKGWSTVDAPFDLADALRAVPTGQPVLVDCLTLWLSNHMLAENDTDACCDELAEILSAPRGHWFVVSNEVGFGIVPDNPLGRRFRDEQGRLNQKIAAVSDRVLLVVAGLPMQVK
ncbi:MAG: bifunctional adenosylcobinamide kinase/adenosylcobinamide-phosphate guanylyltransferase [Mesorhizobium sp.]|nr:bifunctional adenosylcobinamide kinase/adenosylcobinamide-phosphate guanylyltransferase [Mesorhizobium sp.]MBL8575998.1 bifunctional adenosylcobinamide kinase/adenosylcobinamide-phosphate guanylyltransferase [Mesorhizobium sp.]